MKKSLLLMFSLASLVLLPACMPFAKNCSSCEPCSKGSGGACRNGHSRPKHKGKMKKKNNGNGLGARRLENL